MVPIYAYLVLAAVLFTIGIASFLIPRTIAPFFL